MGPLGGWGTGLLNTALVPLTQICPWPHVSSITNSVHNLYEQDFWLHPGPGRVQFGAGSGSVGFIKHDHGSQQSGNLLGSKLPNLRPQPEKGGVPPPGHRSDPVLFPSKGKMEQEVVRQSSGFSR